MLTQPTIEKLHTMKLSAMAKAFADQMQCPDMAKLSFEERFGLIVDYQISAQEMIIIEALRADPEKAKIVLQILAL